MTLDKLKDMNGKPIWIISEHDDLYHPLLVLRDHQMQSIVDQHKKLKDS